MTAAVERNGNQNGHKAIGDQEAQASVKLARTMTSVPQRLLGREADHVNTFEDACVKMRAVKVMTRITRRTQPTTPGSQNTKRTSVSLGSAACSLEEPQNCEARLSMTPLSLCLIHDLFTYR